MAWSPICGRRITGVRRNAPRQNTAPSRHSGGARFPNRQQRGGIPIQHTRELTRGPVLPVMLRFALPMILGDLLQQCYNIADTLIVGKFLGPDALAAVGSSFTLMTFLTSILLGLCMGSGVVFSLRFGAGETDRLTESAHAAFRLIGLLTAGLMALSFALLPALERFLQVPASVWPEMETYLGLIFWGIGATFLYNYFACYLRAVGNSLVPLLFLALSAGGNIALDLLFILKFHWGVAGAAGATVLAQYAAGAGILLYCQKTCPGLRPKFQKLPRRSYRAIFRFSLLTCVQQSVMNFGILMIQGLVNSFGPTVMAAFAAAVKIDAFAYLPVQDFGGAFSTFIAQNHGAGEGERIRRGLKGALVSVAVFSVLVSAGIVLFAPWLMGLFVEAGETAVIAAGVRYLRIEGAFYVGIGFLFLLYGLCRALGKPGMSVVLTVFSLGTRVALAYALAPWFGVNAVWWAIPIGWGLADTVGFVYYGVKRGELLPRSKPPAVS